MSIQVTVMSIDFDSFEEPITKTFSKNEITLGRKPTNDLVLDRIEVSGVHARLSIKEDGEDGQLYVTDLGSSNGTMLERDTLTPDVAVPINANQRLIIGSYLVKPSIVPTEENGHANGESKHTNGFASHSEESQLVNEPLSELPEFKSAATLETYSSIPAVKLADFDISEESQEEKEEVKVEANVEHSSEHSDEFKFNSSSKEVSESPIDSGEPATIKINVDGDTMLNVHFTAAELFALRGGVEHGGSALSAVTVDAGDLGKVETDSEGKFSFSDVVEGTHYHLSLSKIGYLLEPAVFAGTLDSDVNVSVNASKLFKLSGRVLHKGNGVAGVRIEGGANGAQISGPDGSFVFTNLREDSSYELKADHSNYVFDCSNPGGKLDGDREINFTARQLVRIGGQIMHKGKPLADVEVECVGFGKATTDSNGMYHFDKVPEGIEYVIRAAKPGFKLNPSQK